jgi:phenylalanyl-tRNA synthetase beta chain
MKINIEALYTLIKKNINISDLIEKLTILGFESNKIENYIDIDVPYNRKNCNNVISILNEIKNFDKKFSIKFFNDFKINIKKKDKIAIKIEEPNFCPLYSFAILDSINFNNLIPTYIKETLKLNGVNSINGLIDVTNYATIITGQPFHCYDLASLGDEIIINKNHEKSTFYSINDLKLELDSDIWVIKSKNNIISLPGIIGSLDSKVSENTRSILLESAFFNNTEVKLMKEKLKISTNSSERFVNCIDFNLTIQALNYVSELIVNIFDSKKRYINFKINKKLLPKNKKIKINKKILYSLLTNNFNDKKFLNCIKNLYLKKKIYNKNIIFTIPNHRKDLEIKENIFSEIVKLYGYNNIIPKKLESISIETNVDININDKISSFFKNIGFSEIISYSFVEHNSEKLLTSKKTYIHIKNPMSEKMDVMRQTLIYGLIKSATVNINRQNNNLKLFEIGNVYETCKTNEFLTKKILSIAITEKLNNVNIFFYIKNIIKELLKSIYNISNVDFIKNDCIFYNNEISSLILLNKIEIGDIGLIKKSILNFFSVKQDIYVCSLFLNKINNNGIKTFEEISKYPFITRDLSIIFKTNIFYKNIIDFINTLKIENLINISFLDFYDIDLITKSLTLRFKFGSKSKTLLDDEVFSSMMLIQEKLKYNFNIDIRI